MKQFGKIAIIGVGLIGGSIGLAVKDKRLAKEIVGVCRHKKSLRKAMGIGAIDKGTLDCKNAVANADLVILAVPVSQIIRIIKSSIPYLKDDCLITDVGSTKSEVVREIEKVLPKKFHFVGGHPLAGSEKRGVTEARADLFKGTICILTKTKKTKTSAVKKIASFWKKMGSGVTVLPAQKHDRIVAMVSHLPHLASTQLVKAAKGNLAYAASGFLDTTRIASSDAEIWTDIFLTNKRYIIQAIDRYIAQLKSIRDLIRREDRRKLSAEFRTIKRLRDALQK